MYLAAYSNQYRKQDVMNASPLRLVIMTYDLAILSCEKATGFVLCPPRWPENQAGRCDFAAPRR